MAIVTGMVEAKSDKFDKFSIKVGDNWYSSKYEIKAERGDMVEFDDGDKKYCRKLRVTGGASSGGGGGGTTVNTSPAATGFPIPTRHQSRSIIRQNSLTNARELYINFANGEETFPEAVDAIIDIARKFEAYSAGDADYEAVQNKLKDFDPED
jgi:hypothetical protein